MTGAGLAELAELAELTELIKLMELTKLTEQALLCFHLSNNIHKGLALSLGKNYCHVLLMGIMLI